mmetsp:Transcript_13017/g.37831  ORF Transcript_13017/g.37831 Transcript_13017/m.37831 type:complete len:88 (+) Transcript_13017:559-822(+)
MLSIGRLDKMAGFSDVQAGEAAVDKIKSGGAEAQMHVYETAGHSFFNAAAKTHGIAQLQMHGQPVASDEDIKLASERLFAFLKKHLA